MKYAYVVMSRKATLMCLNFRHPIGGLIGRAGLDSDGKAETNSELGEGGGKGEGGGGALPAGAIDDRVSEIAGLRGGRRRGGSTTSDDNGAVNERARSRGGWKGGRSIEGNARGCTP